MKLTGDRYLFVCCFSFLLCILALFCVHYLICVCHLRLKQPLSPARQVLCPNFFILLFLSLNISSFLYCINLNKYLLFFIILFILLISN